MPAKSREAGMARVNPRWFLAAALLLAVCFRFFALDNYPPGFFCDEADIANNAQALWQHGRDTWGVRFPVFFQALGDYKNPVAIYSSIPFVAVFGMHPHSVRAMAALYGCLTVLAIFLLMAELFDEETGAWSALLLAICPWHVHLSRIGMEFSPGIFWVTFSLYALLRGLRELTWFAVGCGALILGLLSYYTPWLYLPPLLVALLAIHWPAVRKRWLGKRRFWVICACAIGIFAALVGPSLHNGSLLTRWHSVSRAMSLKDLWQGYRNHFSQAFLFTRGDAGFEGAGVTRHSLVGMGELFRIELPFLLLAPLAWHFWRKRRASLLTLLALLAVYPLGTIFTATNPFATRSAIGVVALTALCAVGIRLAQTVYRRDWLRHAVTASVAAGLVLGVIELRERVRQYRVFAEGYYGWQRSGLAAFRLMRTKQNRYDQVLVTHRFNAGEALRDFFLRGNPCPRCGLHSNPLVLNEDKYQLFATHPDDVEQTLLSYPGVHFFEQQRFYNGGGEVELRVGTFSRLPPLQPDETHIAEGTARALAGSSK